MAPSLAKGYDPWKELQRLSSGDNKSKKESLKEEDPWVKLRSIYLPFTEEEESEALKKKLPRKKVASYFLKTLKPYRDIIDECSKKFNIPAPVIQGMIIVESGGNRYARAKKSSAKGLMQTIDSTFKEARENLKDSLALLLS